MFLDTTQNTVAVSVTDIARSQWIADQVLTVVRGGEKHCAEYARNKPNKEMNQTK
jgi:hypothetical protein